MCFEGRTMRKRAVTKGRGWVIPLFVPVLLLICAAVYVSVYYHADETALLAMQANETVSVTETACGWLFDGPGEDTALIFYPGAKVEAEAYAPLLRSLAEQGVDVCLMKLPFRLALLGGSAARRAIEAHDYEKWYIGGHSLGGVVAASYAAKHADTVAGVILLAAYPIKQIPDPLMELLLVGSEDRVINRKRLEASTSLAPESFVEHIIEGGNHAQFGSYGPQKGDGIATITPTEQLRETVGVILQTLGAEP